MSLCVRRVAVVAAVSGLAGCASTVTVVDGRCRGIGDRPLLSVPAPSAETARPLASANGSEVARNAGWRMGMVQVGGAVADTLRDKDLDTQLSVWGYQFEYHYGILGGINGLVTIMPMIVGLESSASIPVLNVVIGLRFANGFEFGGGLHYSARLEYQEDVPGLGAAFSVGYAIRTGAEGRVSIPFNFGYVKAGDSEAYTITVGWTIPKE